MRHRMEPARRRHDDRQDSCRDGLLIPMRGIQASSPTLTAPVPVGPLRVMRGPPRGIEPLPKAFCRTATTGLDTTTIRWRPLVESNTNEIGN